MFFSLFLIDWGRLKKKKKTLKDGKEKQGWTHRLECAGTLYSLAKKKNTSQETRALP